MTTTLTVNGAMRTVEIDPGDILLDVLRREGTLEVRGDCHTGDCGVCTVLLDGRPVASCLMFAAKAAGHAITTVRGVGTEAHPHPLQEAFVHNGAVQCGYCIPGAILAAKALLDENPDPDDQAIRLGMDSNYCRCTGYEQQIEAVKAAAAAMREDVHQ
jgi:carbon-monoxide dehydrogenase small subunit